MRESLVIETSINICLKESKIARSLKQEAYVRKLGLPVLSCPNFPYYLTFVHTSTLFTRLALHLTS